MDRTCLMGTIRNLCFYVLCRVRCNLSGQQAVRTVFAYKSIRPLHQQLRHCLLEAARPAGNEALSLPGSVKPWG